MEQQQSEVMLTTMQATLAVMKAEIDPMWILCDSESTVDTFKNKSMVVDIRKTDNPIWIKGIDGNVITVNEEATLLGYGRVYYHPQVTANVLSFFNMARRFKSVTYNNQDSNIFKVMRDDGSVMEFSPSKEGLYYYEFNTSIQRKQEEIHNTMVIDTVEQLKQNYSKRELEAVERARRLYVTMGRPSDIAFETMIKKEKIINNPVTCTDFRNAIKI